MPKHKKLTVISSCGCISQYPKGRKHSSYMLHIYCGNKKCPFDPQGFHRKIKEKG